MSGDKYGLDQFAFNATLYDRVRDFARLPAWCNWMCHIALPYVDEQDRLLEAGYPHRPLGIVHMAAKTRDAAFPLKLPNNTPPT